MGDGDVVLSKGNVRPLKLLIGGLCLIAIACLMGAAVLQQVRVPHLVDDWFIYVAFALITLVGMLASMGQPHNGTGWVLLGSGLFIGFSALSGELAFHPQLSLKFPDGAILALWLSGFGWYTGAMLLFLIFPFLFPSGRVPAGRLWKVFFWLAITFVLGVIGFQLWGGLTMLPGGVTMAEINYSQAQLESTLVIMLPLLLLGSASQIARYGQTDSAERKQMKWLLLTLGVAMAAFLILGTVEQTGTATISNVFWGFIYLLIPAGLGIALLRYRLFDVDTVIRRGTAYLILTALLALTYFSTVIVLQSLVGRTAAAQSPLIIVLSTLLIAALFTPLHHRIQHLIDRRFFRQKYDAQQVMAQFAQAMRDEVLLAALLMELETAVQTTLQPDLVSIWLKEADL